MICKCEDWIKNIDSLNSGFEFMATHGMSGYTGKIFVYCPWCGKELEKENEEE